MLTIFSIPKPFTGHNDLIQRNAVQSWQSLPGNNEIILFGNDEGVSAAAKEYQVIHYPQIKLNEFGTPLVGSAFALARQMAKQDILVYLNADIILLADFIEAIKKIKEQNYFIIGRRRDWELPAKIDYNLPNWEIALRQEIARHGKLHGYSGIDYMVFPRGLSLDLPEFAIGRQGWDNWVIWKVKEMRIPVIDATKTITAVHQNHDFAHSRYGEKDRVGGPETKKNYALAGGFSQMLSIREADWELTDTGLKRPVIQRVIFSWLAKTRIWQLLLSLKRRVNSL